MILEYLVLSHLYLVYEEGLAMFEGTLLCMERNNSEFVALGRSDYGSSIRLNWEPRNLDWHKHISHLVRRPRFKAGKFDEMCDTLMSLERVVVCS